MIEEEYEKLSTDGNNNEKNIMKEEIDKDLFTEYGLYKKIACSNDDNLTESKNCDNNVAKNNNNILNKSLIGSSESLQTNDSSISCSKYSLQLSVSSFEQNSLENSIILEKSSSESNIKEDENVKMANWEKQMKASVMDELNKIECKLPELDFKKIEETLHNSAVEHDMISRKLLGDQVRRRLALQYEELITGPSPPINTYPQKSNLGARLKAANKLQLCYLNEMHYEENNSDLNKYPNSFYKIKSKSAPNIKANNKNSNGLSFQKKSTLANTLKETITKQNKQSYDRTQSKAIIDKESHIILHKAKESAKLQFDFEKKTGRFVSSKNPTAKKLSRIDLSKKNNYELYALFKDLQTKVDEQNNVLVTLLIRRDTLHMQQDSLLCDIDDLLYKKNNIEEVSKLPNFMTLEENFSININENKKRYNDIKCITADNTPRTETGGIFNNLKLSKSYPAGFLNILGIFKK
uniref:SCHIP-1 domain-containing protein n=1 Tax=Parastrongyloides trichosuri TaxID=131310 RepID=A0A0N4ZTH5_PARTI